MTKKQPSMTKKQPSMMRKQPSNQVWKKHEKKTMAGDSHKNHVKILGKSGENPASSVPVEVFFPPGMAGAAGQAAMGIAEICQGRVP